MLLEHDPNFVNKKDENGETLLGWAKKWNYMSVAKLVMEARSQVEARERAVGSASLIPPPPVPLFLSNQRTNMGYV